MCNFVVLPNSYKKLFRSSILMFAVYSEQSSWVVSKQNFPENTRNSHFGAGALYFSRKKSTIINLIFHNVVSSMVLTPHSKVPPLIKSMFTPTHTFDTFSGTEVPIP